ncbi:MAG: contractile injection system tape measure protein [Chitinophagaceae bacterium]
MPIDTSHIIQQNIIDLIIETNDHVQVEEEVAALFKSQLGNSINKLFTDHSPGENVLVINTLQLDLGTIPRNLLQEEFIHRLLRQLKQALARYSYAIHRSSHDHSFISLQQSQLQSLSFFLQFGYLPWQYKGKQVLSIEQLFTNCIQQVPNQIKRFLIQHAANKNCIKRIVQQFSEKLVYSLINLLQPAEALFIITYLEEMKESHRKNKPVQLKQQIPEKTRLQVVLTYLLNERGSFFNRKEFLKITLRQMAQEHGVNYFELLHWLKNGLQATILHNLQKARFSSLIHTILSEELENNNQVSHITQQPQQLLTTVLFKQIVHAGPDHCIVDVRSDSQAKQLLQYNPAGFSQQLHEYLYRQHKLPQGKTMPVLLCVDSTSVVIPGMLKLSEQSLALLFKHYIAKGQLYGQYAALSKNIFRHLFVSWLQQQPVNLKQLLPKVLEQMDVSHTSQKQFTTFSPLFRALQLLHEQPHAVIGTVRQLFMLQLKQQITVKYPAYFRKYIVLNTLQYILQQKQLASITAYNKHILAVASKEFSLSLLHLQQLMASKNHYPTSSFLHFTNKLPPAFLSQNGFLYPGGTSAVIPIGKSVDLLSSGLSNTNENVFLSNTTLSFAKTQHYSYDRFTPHHLVTAITYYLLNGKVCWWGNLSEEDIPGAIAHLIRQRNNVFLRTLLQHRHTSAFVKNLLYVLVKNPSIGFNQTVTGFSTKQQQHLLEIHTFLYEYFTGQKINPQNAQIKLFQILLQLINEKKQWNVTREELISLWIQQLFPGRKAILYAIEKLSYRASLTLTSESIGLLNWPDLFYQQIQAMFISAQKQPLTDLATFYIRSLVNWLTISFKNNNISRSVAQKRTLLLQSVQLQYPQYQSLLQPFAKILLQETAFSFTKLIEQINAIQAKDKALAAMLLRRLLSKEYNIKLQHTNVPVQDLVRAVTILLKYHRQSLSLIKTIETVFPAIPVAGPYSTQLFWRITLDVLLKQSSFNQLYFTRNWLIKMSASLQIELPNLIADLLLYLQYDNNDPNKKALRKLIMAIADEKKIRSLTGRKEKLILIDKVITNSKNVETKKNTGTQTLQKPAILKPEDAIYINNAGLVLIHPFVKMLFERMEYVKEGKFDAEESTVRAIHLLQFIAAGFDNVEEHYLFFNKILCGLDPLLPIEKEITLTGPEKEVAESLLLSVISNWEAVKNSSIDGLRGSFLLREGKLVREEKAWKLTIQKKPYDILLKQLPWGISTIKFIWMPEPIYVQWI